MVNLLLGGAVISIALIGAIWPRRVARFSEQVDGIGRRRPQGEVRPTDWKVQLVQLSGIVVALFGVLILFDL